MAAQLSTRSGSAGEQFEGTGGESDVVSFLCALESTSFSITSVLKEWLLIVYRHAIG